MKKVEATIRPFLLDDVRDALLALGMQKVTIAEVKSLDPRARPASYRGSSYVTWFAPEIKLEVVVPDEQVDDCVETIRAYGKTDETPQHAILITTVEDAAATRVAGGRGPRSTAHRRERMASLVRR